MHSFRLFCILYLFNIYLPLNIGICLHLIGPTQTRLEYIKSQFHEAICNVHIKLCVVLVPNTYLFIFFSDRILFRLYIRHFLQFGNLNLL
jgi:hypothetical protein